MKQSSRARIQGSLVCANALLPSRYLRASCVRTLPCDYALFARSWSFSAARSCRVAGAARNSYDNSSCSRWRSSRDRPRLAARGPRGSSLVRLLSPSCARAYVLGARSSGAWRQSVSTDPQCARAHHRALQGLRSSRPCALAPMEARYAYARSPAVSNEPPSRRRPHILRALGIG